MHVDFYWCIIVYTLHILWLLDVKSYDIFLNIFFLPAKLHPLKISLLFSHHQSIILNLESCVQKTLVCLFQKTDNLFSIALHFSYTGDSETGQYKEHLLCQKCLSKSRNKRLLRAIVWEILRYCEEEVSFLEEKYQSFIHRILG